MFDVTQQSQMLIRHYPITWDGQMDNRGSFLVQCFLVKLGGIFLQLDE